MARLRAVTTQHCLRCRARAVSDADREALAVHRMEHRRADRRRAQWRAAKRRKQRLTGAYGALHALSCSGPKHCTCSPIPVYRASEVAA